MAGKTSGKTSSTIKQFNKTCWETIDREALQSLAKEKYPNNKWDLKGNKLVGICPFHPDTNPSFEIDFKKNRILCRGAGCDYNRYQPSLLIFIKDLLKMSANDAFKIITGRLGVTQVAKEQINANEEFIQKQKDYMTFQRLCNCKAAELLSNSDELNKEENARYRPHINYIRERGIYNANNFHLLPIGVYIQGSDLASSLSEEEYIRISKLLTKFNHHCFKTILFYKNTQIYMTHAQVRDADRSIRPQNLLFAPEIGPGFLCPDLISQVGVQTNNIFVTEGDFDCLSYYANVLGRDDVNPYFLVGTGGNLGSSLDVLSDLLTDENGFINIFFDHPDKRGDDLVRSYKKVTRGGNYNVFDWRNTNLPQSIHNKKDMDDLIQTTDPNLGWRFVHGCFHNTKDYFISIFDWFAYDTKRQIEKLTADQNTLYNKYKIIRRQLRNFTTGSQHSILTSTINKLLGIDCTHLSVPSVLGDPTKDQFLADLKCVLEEDLIFFAKKSNKFCFQNSETKMMRECTTQQQDLENKLNIDLGPWSSWLQSKMGIPEFLKIKRKVNNGITEYFDPMELNKQITKYIHHIMQLILKTLPEEDTFTAISHGTYYDVESNTPYLLNGPDVFIGEEVPIIDNKYGYTTKWSRISTPTKDKFFFRSEYIRWNNFISNCDHINNQQDDDFVWAYEKGKEIFSCWGFKDPYDVEYLSALALTMEIQQIFDMAVRLHIIGEKGSGKSKLLNLWTGEVNPHLRLFLNSLNFSNASEAGWRQDTSNKLGTCVMDEFECNPSSPHYQSYTKILSAMRGLGRKNEVTKGQVNPDNSLVGGSKPVTYSLRFSMIAASISEIVNESGADSQRFLPLEMAHEKNRLSPLELILTKLNEDELLRYKKFLNISVYKFLHAINRNYLELKTRSFSEHWYKEGTNRTADLIIPAVTIWKMLGLDYKKMFMDYMNIKEKRMKKGLGQPQYEVIYNSVMDTRQYFLVDSEGRHQLMTPWDALSDEKYKQFFNESTTGLFYQPIKQGEVLYHYLLVHWRTIFNSLSFKNNNKGTLTAETIATTANRYTDRILTPEKLIAFVHRYAPKYITMTNDITVYNISDRVEGLFKRELEIAKNERIDPNDIPIY